MIVWRSWRWFDRRNGRTDINRGDSTVGCTPRAVRESGLEKRGIWCWGRVDIRRSADDRGRANEEPRQPGDGAGFSSTGLVARGAEKRHHDRSISLGKWKTLPGDPAARGMEPNALTLRGRVRYRTDIRIFL
jgi:hypothetical protein